MMYAVINYQENPTALHMPLHKYCKGSRAMCPLLRKNKIFLLSFNSNCLRYYLNQFCCEVWTPEGTEVVEKLHLFVYAITYSVGPPDTRYRVCNHCYSKSSSPNSACATDRLRNELTRPCIINNFIDAFNQYDRFTFHWQMP